MFSATDLLLAAVWWGLLTGLGEGWLASSYIWHDLTRAGVQTEPLLFAAVAVALVALIRGRGVNRSGLVRFTCLFSALSLFAMISRGMAALVPPLALLAAISPDFLVLVAIALVVVVVGWIELRILVYAAVFLIPWQIYMMNMPGSTYTFRLEDVVVAVATAATVVRFPGTLRVCLTGWMIPILLFVAVAVGQGLASGDVYDTGKFIAD